MAVCITNSAEETEKIGEKLAQRLPKRVFALIGELGSGKTTFVKGFARRLGIKKRIISPSFVLIRQYGNLYHVDLYRLEKPSGVEGLGLEEIWNNPDNIVIIEWAERIKKILPKDRVEICFKYVGENKREIEIR